MERRLGQLDGVVARRESAPEGLLSPSCCFFAQQATEEKVITNRPPSHWLLASVTLLKKRAESRPSRASRRSPLASNSTMDIGKIVDGLFGELFAPVGCCMKRNKTEDNPLFDGK